MNLIDINTYHSEDIQQFFDYCSTDMTDASFFDHKLLKIVQRCTCSKRDDGTITTNMSCAKVKLFIELIQLMPFISVLLVLADFYIFLLVFFVYVYEKRSLIDYLPMPDEYDIA
ncbi:unnamed protein product [Didymodactylos carnosus]|uniref:Uncharacterized protein n=1 Tax=Didymodactylos carnosus TaxID=1234261 RepID=A0A813SVE5_9BILA|nr:unnamed protein product [Didymodactylos carnosus]CAF3587081.1 unnamed protein product [Didymodactylos carnosus]